MKKCFLIFAFFIFFVTILSAQSILTAGQLHDYWSSYDIPNKDQTPIDHGNTMYYLGYITAFMDLTDKMELLSYPRKITVGQLCAIVGKYLDNHPEEWDKNAVDTVYRSLNVYYGIQKKD